MWCITVSYFSLNYQLHHGRDSVNLVNVNKPGQTHCAGLRMQPLVLHGTGNALLPWKHAQHVLCNEKSMSPHTIYSIISFGSGKCSQGKKSQSTNTNMITEIVNLLTERVRSSGEVIDLCVFVFVYLCFLKLWET